MTARHTARSAARLCVAPAHVMCWGLGRWLTGFATDWGLRRQAGMRTGRPV